MNQNSNSNVDTLNLQSTNVGGLWLPRDSISIMVSKDKKAVYARKNNKIIWEVFPMKEYPLLNEEEQEIRTLWSDSVKVYFVVGKHCSYEIMRQDGYLRFLGCD